MNQRYADYFALHAKCAAQNGSDMSWADAVALFDEIKGLKSMEIEHNDDRCADRCGLIQELLEAQGVEHGLLMIEFPETHGWYMHFGAIGVLDTGQQVIFDPMTFDTPLTREKWIEAWTQNPEFHVIDPKCMGFMSRKDIQTSLENISKHAEAKSEQASEPEAAIT